MPLSDRQLLPRLNRLHQVPTPPWCRRPSNCATNSAPVLDKSRYCAPSCEGGALRRVHKEGDIWSWPQRAFRTSLAGSSSHKLVQAAIAAPPSRPGRLEAGRGPRTPSGSGGLLVGGEANRLISEQVRLQAESLS